jgi:hypothetical protein
VDIVTPDDVAKALLDRWNALASTVGVKVPAGLYRDRFYELAGGAGEQSPGPYAVFTVRGEGDEEFFTSSAYHLAKYAAEFGVYADQNTVIPADEVALAVLPMANWVPTALTFREGRAEQVTAGVPSSEFAPQLRNGSDVVVLRFRLNLLVSGTRLTA